VFGFQSFAYSGPEPVSKIGELRDSSEQTDICSNDPNAADNPIADHIYKHGDGVKSDRAQSERRGPRPGRKPPKRGGKSYLEPKTLKDKHGKVIMSGIHTYGEVVHVFCRA